MGSGASSQIGSKPGSAVDVSKSPSPTHSTHPQPQALKSPVSGAGDTVRLFQVTSKKSASDQRTSDVVHDLRSSKGQKASGSSAISSLSTQSLTAPGAQGTRQSQKQVDATLQCFSTAELQKKIKELEHELAKSESNRLDLQDQVQDLQERCKPAAPSDLPAPVGTVGSFSETLHAKDQYINKLEADLKSVQSEFNKTRLKLKKRIRVLTNQLHEVRQEASISQMEMKAQMSQQREQFEKNSYGATSSNGDKEISGYEASHESGHSKIIVELSNQLSEQSEQIASLEAELAEKNVRIEELEKTVRDKNAHAASNTLSAGDGDNENQTSKDRLHSSRGKRPNGNAFSHMTQPPRTSHTPTRTSATHGAYRDSLPGGGLGRQSTALSDSDSDWEVDSIPSHTQSAPAHGRVKSALSTSSSVKARGDAMSTLGDDDSIMDSTNPYKAKAATPDRRVRTLKKSTLRTRLEQEKNNKQTSALMGPTLAFATKSKEPPSDTSCEPTPRYTDPSSLPGFSKLKVVHPSDY